MADEQWLYPYFTVPPASEQARLFEERITGMVGAPAFHLAGARMGQRRSMQRRNAAVYFGSLLVYEGEESRCFDEEDFAQCVLADLGYAFAGPVRIDYACTEERTYFLRAGRPCHVPTAYSAYGPETLRFVERYIDAFLATDCRGMLLGRAIMHAGKDVLFEGEHRLYEGFLGQGGLPFAASGADGQHVSDSESGLGVLSPDGDACSGPAS